MWKRKSKTDTNQRCCMFLGPLCLPPLPTILRHWVGKSTLHLYKYFIANSILNSRWKKQKCSNCLFFHHALSAFLHQLSLCLSLHPAPTLRLFPCILPSLPLYLHLPSSLVCTVSSLLFFIHLLPLISFFFLLYGVDMFLDLMFHIFTYLSFVSYYITSSFPFTLS